MAARHVAREGAPYAVVYRDDNDHLIAVRRNTYSDGIGHHAINTIFVAGLPNAPDAAKDAPFNTVPYTVTHTKIKEYKLTSTTVELHFKSDGECIYGEVRSLGEQTNRSALRNAIGLLQRERMVEKWDRTTSNLVQPTGYHTVDTFSLPGLKVIDTGFGVTFDDEAFAGFAVRSFRNEARTRSVKRARRRATWSASVRHRPSTVVLK